MNVLITRHCVLMTTNDVLICQGHTDVIAEMVTIGSMESVKVNTHLYSSVCAHTHSTMCIICTCLCGNLKPAY